MREGEEGENINAPVNIYFMYRVGMNYTFIILSNIILNY